MRTLLWSYLGWRRFSRDMSAFEIRHFLSFSVADKRELRVLWSALIRSRQSMPTQSRCGIINP